MTHRTYALERRGQVDKTAVIPAGSATVLLTPKIDEEYWSYRVRLNHRQAVIAFPKFGTIGVGFAREDDWNTNLPYTCSTLEIVSHIWHNVDTDKPEALLLGDEFDPEDNLSILDVYAAVDAIQRAIAIDHPERDAPGSQEVYGQPEVTGVGPLNPPDPESP